MKKLFGFVHILLLLILIFTNLSIYISPVKFEYAALLGLAYPVILLTTFVFLIISVILKSKIAWANVILIGFSLFHLHAFIGMGSPKKITSEHSTFKITSFNARLFDKYEWIGKAPHTKVKIYSYLDQQNSDIYAFQEFYTEDSPSHFNTQKELSILFNSTYEYGYYSHHMSNTKHFGLQLFSKKKIINKGNIIFKNDNNNGVIFIDILLKKDTVRIYNMHLGSIRFQDKDYHLFSNKAKFKEKSKGTGRIINRLTSAYSKRAEQVDLLKKHMNDCPYKIIVCGDLNDTPISYSYHHLSKNMLDSFLETNKGFGTTYEGKIPANRIDYIFSSPELKPYEFQIQEEVLSDHRAINASFEY